jgi:ribosome-binding protein aMBF1 (putative translation factor)
VVAKLAIENTMQGRTMPVTRSNREATSRDTDAVNPKKKAGSWLREQRQKAGLSQMDLAIKLGFKYYTFISQIENGYGRVPSQSMADWARALGLRPERFARILLGYYDPALYRVLFKDGLP